jgi:hypothetical protein
MPITLAQFQKKFLEYKNNEEKLIVYCEIIGDEIYSKKMKLKFKAKKNIHKELSQKISEILSKHGDVGNKLKKEYILMKPVRHRFLDALLPIIGEEPEHQSFSLYKQDFLNKVIYSDIPQDTKDELKGIISKYFEEFLLKWKTEKMNYEIYKIQKWVDEVL